LNLGEAYTLHYKTMNRKVAIKEVNIILKKCEYCETIDGDAIMKP
jgi:hypothetical protein